MSKAIILMGGPSRGTRFRPLSLEIPKPLFPIAGIPLVEHHIIACKKLEDLKEIILLGFYKEEEIKDFVQYIIEKHKVKISYLNEEVRSGTAGGLYVFRERILEGNPEFIFILHSDIVCTFPLKEIREYHQKHGQFATIMATHVPKEHSVQFGCLVSDENNNVVHFAEKPHSYISDLINTGIYCFSKDIITEIEKIYNKAQNSTEMGTLYHSMDQFFVESTNTPYVRLEQDVIFQHVGTGKLKSFIYKDFWRQIKNAGSAVYCNSLILSDYAKYDSGLLAKNVNYKLVGNNFIDKTAVIDPSAKIGPNVFIGPNVKIGKGVRIKESIVLTSSEIKDNACLLNCIIGWDCVVGNWTRVEGIYNPSPKQFSNSDKREGITIFGKGARAKPEIIVYNCIVMPHKDLDRSYKNSILL